MADTELTDTTFISVLDFAFWAVKALCDAICELTGSLRKGGIDVPPFLGPVHKSLCDIRTLLAEQDEDQTDIGEEDLLKLVNYLERFAKWPLRMERKTGVFTSVHFPRLNDILRGAQGSESMVINCLSKLATTQPPDELSERASKDRNSFLRIFDRFGKTRSSDRGLSLFDDMLVTGALPGRGEDRSVHLQTLHTNLSGTLAHKNVCRLDFHVNLAVTDVKRIAEEDDQMVPIHMMMHHSHPSVPCMWREVRVRVILHSVPSAASRVQIQLPYSQQAQPADLCQMVRRPAHGRLLLNAFDEGLFEVDQEMGGSLDMHLDILEWSPSVSLATILSERKIASNTQLKLQLSQLLAKAVWQFYDSDWMSEGWSRHDIHFMREAKMQEDGFEEVVTLIHRPFFSTRLGPSSLVKNTSTFGGGEDYGTLFCPTHRYPKILALGIMLLEIELGHGLDYDTTFQNADHRAAQRIVGTEMWKKRKMYRLVREVIDICLKPDQLGKNPAEVRSKLYEWVVAPLTKFFKITNPRNRDPEDFVPKPVSFGPRKNSMDDLRTSETLRANSRGLGARSSLNIDACFPGDSQKLLQILEPPDSGIILSSRRGSEDTLAGAEDDLKKRTDKKMNEFQMLMHKMSGKSHRAPMKIAILDSGLDSCLAGFNREDRERVMEEVSFIGGDGETLDKTGHGTHVAAIILRLTHDVKLYIAKITDTKTVKSREAVTKAIVYARDVWEVDMMCLSFGFEHRPPDDMIYEIEECIRRKIIIVASASNEGGDGMCTYPAKLHNVVCAYAADDMGNKYPRNPPPAKEHNFSFVGMLLRPAWDFSAPKNAMGSRLDYKSGTSYAAPIACATAVLMIGFICRRYPTTKWRIKPQSPDGIHKIFKVMMISPDSYDFVSATGFFRRFEEVTIYGDLVRELGLEHIQGLN